LSQPREYQGPFFVAHDEAGNDYMLVPVYRCNLDDAGEQVGHGYRLNDLARIWTANGQAVRRDSAGCYTILDQDPRREVKLVSHHPKAV
jgi:hypothetical protein